MKQKKKSSAEWILEFAGQKKSFYVVSIILSVLSVLEPGENNHFEPGENNHFRPAQNSQRTLYY